MPSSGYPMETFGGYSLDEDSENYKVIEANAKHALELGMFIEWLECFVGAYNHIKNKDNLTRVREGQTPYTAGEAANLASQAGIIEWDM